MQAEMCGCASCRLHRAQPGQERRLQSPACLLSPSPLRLQPRAAVDAQLSPSALDAPRAPAAQEVASAFAPLLEQVSRLRQDVAALRAEFATSSRSRGSASYARTSEWVERSSASVSSAASAVTSASAAGRYKLDWQPSVCVCDVTSHCVSCYPWLAVGRGASGLREPPIKIPTLPTLQTAPPSPPTIAPRRPLLYQASPSEGRQAAAATEPFRLRAVSHAACASAGEPLAFSTPAANAASGFGRAEERRDLRATGVGASDCGRASQRTPSVQAGEARGVASLGAAAASAAGPAQARDDDALLQLLRLTLNDGPKDSPRAFTKFDMKMLELSLPTFGGGLTEDPRRFLAVCEAKFRPSETSAGVPKDCWVNLAASRLRGRAHKWWNARIYVVDTPWAMFRSKFLAEFDDPHLLTSLRASLYGDRQAADKAVTDFIEEKLELHQRLCDGELESAFFPHIVELMRVELRAGLRRCTFASREELVRAARQAEKDAKELAQKHTAGRTVDAKMPTGGPSSKASAGGAADSASAASKPPAGADKAQPGGPRPWHRDEQRQSGGARPPKQENSAGNGTGNRM